jgi:hypothetical protein
VKAASVLLLSLLAALAAPGAARAATTATVNYVVTLGGANIALAEVHLSDDGRRYALDLKADVAGLGQLVASGTAAADSAGTLDRDSLKSQKFDLLTRAGGESFSISIEYAAGEVTKFVVEPPLLNNIDRVPLERKDLHGVNDMVAAFILRAPALDPAVCNRKMQVFTGLERFDLVMRYAQDDVATSPRTGYQGPVVLCKIRYVPVSGHFTTSEMTSFLAKSDRILIWYAPLGTTGYMIPYRVVVGTSVGDLSMVLTAAKS